MASIIKKKIRGQIYYYAVESKRVDGKPRIVWQKYLGKANHIIQVMASMEDQPSPHSARVYGFGAEAALLAIARRLQVAEIINKNIGWSGEGLSAGEHILLQAINLSVEPETRLSSWFDRTMLSHHFRVSSRSLTDKRFWSVAELLSPAVLHKIQDELAKKIFKEFSPGPGALVYNGIRLPCHYEEHSRRNDLASLHIGILTTREFAVPLIYEVFPGDRPEGDGSKKSVERLIERYCNLGNEGKDVTVVEHVLIGTREAAFRPTGDIHFLCALNLNDYEDLLKVPLERFHVLRMGQRNKIKAFRASKKLGDKNITTLVVCSEEEFESQLEEVRADLRRRLKTLLSLKGLSADKAERDGMSSDDNSNNQNLEYKISGADLVLQRNKIWGKVLLSTDNVHWENEEIYRTFFGRGELVAAINRMKLRSGMRQTPTNDSRTGVYVFCLMLAQTMQSLVRRELYRCGVTGNFPEILKLLSEIREVAVTYDKSGLRHRMKECVNIAELDPKQKEIYDCLNLDQFVSGGGSDDK